MNFLARLLDSGDSGVEAHTVAGLATMLAHTGMQAWSVWHGHPFDPQAFGTGSATIIGAMGAAGWMQGKQRQAESPPAPPPASQS